MNREYPVFFEGKPTRSTIIHPTVDRIRKRDGIEVWVNTHATEPRWEAVAHGNGALGIGTLTFADDPNVAILDCSTRLRYQRLRIRRGT